MTSPEASKYQAAPWQPTVDTSASDAKDEKAAAADYDKTYKGTPTYTTTEPKSGDNWGTYAYPTLDMAYTKAPDLIPLPNTGAQSSGGTPPATASPFSIQLAYLMTSEQACLDATKTTIDGYNTLVPIVRSAINSNSIFGQIVGSEEYHPDTKYNETVGQVGNVVTFDNLDKEGTNFAAAINPQMEYLLQSVGNAIEAMGAFTAMLDDAGQMYTDADSQSKFPPPGLMTGGIIPPGQGPANA
jgi:hypothetical protein